MSAEKYNQLTFNSLTNIFHEETLDARTTVNSAADNDDKVTALLEQIPQIIVKLRVHCPQPAPPIDQMEFHLMNWSDGVTVKLDESLLFVLSTIEPTYFDFSCGNRRTVCNYSNTCTQHSSDISHTTNTGVSMLAQSVYLKKVSRSDPQLVFFTAYQNAKLHQFGPATFCILTENKVYYWVLYNNRDTIGSYTTTQHGFTLAPVGQDDAGMFRVIPHEPNNEPSLGMVTAVGPSARDPTTTQRMYRAPDFGPNVTVYQEMCRRADEQADQARLQDVMDHTRAVENEPPVVATVPPIPLSPQQTKMRMRVLMGIDFCTEKSFLADTLFCLPLADEDVQSIYVGSCLSEYPPTHTSQMTVSSMVQALTEHGSMIESGMLFHGALSTSICVHTAKLMCVVVSDTFSDELRNRLSGRRLEHGIIIVVCSQQAPDFEKVRINAAVLVGNGTQLVIVQPDGRFLHVYGTWYGDDLDPTRLLPTRFEDVTAHVRSVLSGDIVSAFPSVLHTDIRLTVGGELLDTDAMVRRMTDMTNDDIRSNLPLVQRIAATLEHLSPAERNKATTAIVRSSQDTALTTCMTELASVKKDRVALRVVLKERLMECVDDTTNERVQVVLREVQRLRNHEKEIMKRMYERDNLLNKVFFARMGDGASSGRCRRGKAIAVATEKKNALVDDIELLSDFVNDFEAHAIAVTFDVEDRWEMQRLARDSQYTDMLSPSASAFRCCGHTSRPLEQFDASTAAALVELASSQGQHPLGATDDINRMTLLGTRSYATHDCQLLFLLPEYLEEDVNPDYLDFSPGHLAVTNERAAILRQLYRQLLYTNTRMCVLHRERGSVSIDPWQPQAAWMLVGELTHLLLHIHRHAAPIPSLDTVVDPTDTMACIRRRILIFVFLILGSGKDMMSGIATYASSQRPTVYSLKQHEWQVLAILFASSHGAGWKNTTERQTAFLVRYLNAKVLRPVISALLKRKQHEQAVSAQDTTQEMMRRSGVFQKRLRWAYYLIWKGEPVPTVLLHLLCRNDDGNERFLAKKRDRQRLPYLLLSNTPLEKLNCLAGVSAYAENPDTITMRHVAEFMIAHKLRKEFREHFNRCHAEQKALARKTAPLLLARLLGEKCFVRTFKDYTEPVSEQEVAASRQTTIDTQMMRGKPMHRLMTLFEQWNDPCSFWFGIWDTSPPVDPDEVCSTSSTGEPTDENRTPDEAEEVQETTAELLERAHPYMTHNMHATLKNVFVNTGDGSHLVQSANSIASQLGMTSELWSSFCRFLGWTATDIQMALCDGLEHADEVEGVELEARISRTLMAVTTNATVRNGAELLLTVA
jgi:hypothetical protein